MIGEPAEGKLRRHRADDQHGQHIDHRRLVETGGETVNRQKRQDRAVHQAIHQAGQHQGRGDAQVVQQTALGAALDGRREAPGPGQGKRRQADDGGAGEEWRPALDTGHIDDQRSDRETTPQDKAVDADDPAPGLFLGHLIDPDIAGDEQYFDRRAEKKTDREPGVNIWHGWQ